MSDSGGSSPKVMVPATICNTIKKEVSDTTPDAQVDNLSVQIEEVNANDSSQIPAKKTRISNGVGAENPHPSSSPKCESDSDMDTGSYDGLGEEMIRRQIFQEGEKPAVKLTLFSELFSCSDCGEVFYTQLGLENHHSRNTMKAVVSCPHCNIERNFSNRCRLLNHFKGHGRTPSVASLKTCVTFCAFDTPDESYDYQITVPGSAPAKSTPSQNSYDSAGSFVSQTVQNGLIKTVTHIIPSSFSDANSKFVAARDNVSCFQKEERLKSEYFCRACQTDFVDLPKFFAHIQSGESSASAAHWRQCAVDSVPALTCCSLDLHEALFHEKRSPFLCPECGLSFSDWAAMNEHARSSCSHFSKVAMYGCINKVGRDGDGVEGEGTCNRCFEKVDTLFRHLEDEHVRYVLQCSKCPNAFTTKELLVRHLTSGHGILCQNNYGIDELLVGQMTRKLTQCLLCEVLFCTTLAYRNHFLTKVAEHSRRVIKFRCEICSETFRTRRSLAKHIFHDHEIKQELKGLNANEIPAKPDLSVLLDTSFPSSQTPVNRFCEPIIPKPTSASSESTRTTQLLEWDESNKPNSENFPEENFMAHQMSQQTTCPQCATFVPPISLNTHVCKLNLRQPGKSAFNCKVCLKTFGGNFGFLNHGKDHLNAGLKICMYCSNQMLSEGEQLNEHIRRSHTDNIENFPHNCALCDVSLSERESAELHFQSHHFIGAENRFKCAICGLQFSQVKDLTLHKSLTHAVQNSQIQFPPTAPSVIDSRRATPGPYIIYPCKFCNRKEFLSVQGLRKHVRNHHSDVDFFSIVWNDMKKVVQPDGSYTSATSVQIQNGRKDCKPPYPSQNLEDEIKSVKVEDPGPSPDPIIPIPEARASDGTIQCLKCSDLINFTSEDAFYEHVRNVHIWKEEEDVGEDEPSQKEAVAMNGDNYWCPECSMEFVAKPSFEKHILCAHLYIQNIQEYLDNIGYGRREKPVVENQCEVCRLKCENSFEYEGHIRTHGMAFLKLRKQRKST